MFQGRSARWALASICALILFSPGPVVSREKVPVVVDGTVWEGFGILAAKIRGGGTVKGPVQFALIFGPFQDILGPGEFAIILDDGQVLFGINGTYAEFKPGKFALDLDAASVEETMCDLVALVLGRAPDVCEISSETDLGAVKVARGRAAAKFQSGFDLTLFIGGEGGTVGVQLSFKGKALQG